MKSYNSNATITFNKQNNNRDFCPTKHALMPTKVLVKFIWQTGEANILVLWFTEIAIVEALSGHWFTNYDLLKSNPAILKLKTHNIVNIHIYYYLQKIQNNIPTYYMSELA